MAESWGDWNSDTTGYFNNESICPMNPDSIPIPRTTDLTPQELATAQLLLQHAIKTEEGSEMGEQVNVEAKRNLNELTGASLLLPQEAVPAASKPPEAGKHGE